MCATGEALASVDVVRAWKDEEYFNGLTEIQRAGIPQAPAGLVELDDAQLGGIAAGLRGQCSCQCPPSHHCAAAF
jgi:mersacidin/lichenicidin family type 2 lantibiotic